MSLPCLMLHSSSLPKVHDDILLVIWDLVVIKFALGKLFPIIHLHNFPSVRHIGTIWKVIQVANKHRVVFGYAYSEGHLEAMLRSCFQANGGLLGLLDLRAKMKPPCQ